MTGLGLLWRWTKAFFETAAGRSFGMELPVADSRKEGVAIHLAESIYKLMSRFNGQDTRRKPRHKVAEVLTCIILGLLAGRGDRKHALDWCREREGMLRRYMKLEHGVASPSTACRVLKIVDEDDLAEVLIEWATSIVKTDGALLVVDGKGVRAGAKRSEGERTPYFLNMVDAQTQLLVATIQVGSKDNEKVAFPRWECHFFNFRIRGVFPHS